MTSFFGGVRRDFRQLGNFFFTSSEKGDPHVGQFVGGQSWKAVTGRKNRWDGLLVRASKQVAHLTAERHFKPHDNSLRSRNERTEVEPARY
jgi:hypothetical protein